MSISSFLGGRFSSSSFRRLTRRGQTRELACCAFPAAPLNFELLENRWLFTAIAWDGGGDGVNWNDANNWNRAGDNANVLPTSADDVTIDSAANPTITVRTAVAVRTLVTNEPLTVISGGTLTVSTSADVNATLTVNGGIVAGGPYDLAGGQLAAGASSTSRLSGVSIASGDIVMPAGSRLRVSGGLTLTDGAAIRMTGDNAYIGFEGTQTLASGLVSFENPTGTSHVTVEGTSTLTLGPAVTVRGGRGDLANTQAFTGGTYSLINQGTIVADSAGEAITVGSTGSFANSGTLRAEGGGSLNVTRLAGNLGAASVEGAGSQLALGGPGFVNNLGLAAPAGTTLTLNGSWSSPGGINVNGGTLNLDGSFSTAGLNLPGFNRTGGVVNLTGTLNNAGDTLTLNAATGSWNLVGGTLSGGTLQQSGASLLISGDSNNALSGVIVGSGDVVAPTNARLRVTGGMTIAAGSTLRLTGTNAYVGFVGSQTFSGAIRIENPTGTSHVTVEGASTLTLAPGSTVKGGRGSIATTQVFVGGTYALVNQGTIEADVAGQTLTVGSTTSFTNSGTLRASGGGLLNVTDLTGNLNTATVEGAGSQLTLSGTNYVNNLGLAAPAGTTLTLNGSWSSPGGIDVNGGTLNLGGSFTTAGLNLPGFTRSGGTVNLTGTLNNAGATLPLDAATGSWNLEGGNLSGGTLQQSGASLVIGANTNNTLSGLTVASGDIVVSANDRLRVSGGLTIAPGSALRLTGNAGYVGFVGNQTFSGAIRFESASGTSFVTVEGISTLTLGPATTVTGGRGAIATTQVFIGGTYSLINQGTIQADISGTPIAIGSTGSFTNNGTLRATGGGQLNATRLTGNLNSATVDGTGSQLTLAGTNYINNLGLDVPTGTTLTLDGTWSSPGGIDVNGGTLNLDGSFTTAGLNLAGFTRAGGVVNLTGTLNNAGNTLVLDSATGNWNLQGGTLAGGTLEQSGAGLAITPNTNNTLSGLTVGTGDIVASTGARLRVTGGLTMAAGTALRLTGDNVYVGFVGSQTFSGDLRFQSATGTSHVTVEGTGTLTLGPGAVISGGRGAIGGTQIFIGGTYSVVNQGTIEANVSGTSLTVGATGTVTNTGTLRANGGGQLGVSNLTGNLNAAFVSGAASGLSISGTNYINNAGLAAPIGTTLTLNGSWTSPGGIDVNGGTLNLDGSFTTAGLNLPGFTRTGGVVNLTGTLNNAGDTLTLNPATGSWNLVGGTLSGGTLQQSGASLLLSTDGGNTFSGVTVGSGDIIAGGSAKLRVLSGLTLAPGVAIRLTGGSSFISFFGTQTLASGLISFETPSGTSFVTVEGTGTLTLGPGVTVTGGRGAIATTQIIVGGTYSLANQGTIISNVSGAAINIGGSTPFTNTGTLQATGGGQITLPTFTNNGGTVSVGTSSTMTVSGNYTQSSGTTLLQGGILDPTGTFNLQGGALSGFGTLRANVTSAGQVTPGGVGTAGNLRVEGTYSQSATGVLDMEVGGATAGTLFDRLEVTGAATLDGALNVSVINGYQAPTTGIIYGVLPYASRTGSFASITGLSQPNGRGFTVDYATTRFALISDVSDNAGPVVVSSQPTGLVNANVASVRFQFNEPVNPASFTPSDVLLTTPSGTISSTLIAVIQIDATTFDIQFPAQAQDGNYSIAIGPNVTDLTGNAMSAIHTATFTVDQTGPRVVSVTPSGDINPPLSALEVTFDSEIDPATFQVGDVVLSRPTTPISPSSITRLSATTFRLNFPAQSAPGDYTVRIGPDVRDLAGNQMDQDGDGVRGEAAQDQFTSTATVRAVDLQVTGLSVSAAPSPQSGATLTINWSDTNTGNGATGGSWNDRVRVVNTTTGQTLLDTTVSYDAATLGAIPAGQSRARQRLFTLPDGPAGVGDLQITVTADTGGAIVETNGAGTGETNNSATTNITTTLANYPDLRVLNLSVTPPEQMAGQVMTIRWDDFNDGNGPTRVSWHDKVFIRNLTTGQTLLNTTLFYDRTVAANGDIQPGGSRSRQYQFRVPDGTSGVGQLQVDITADTNNAVFEFNAGGTAETNNTASATTTSVLAPYPDLVAEALSFTSASPKSGDTVAVKWTERNTGNAAVTSSSYTRVRITRAGDGSVVTDQVLFFPAAANAPLTAGGTVNRQHNLTLPNGPAGAGTFNVQITTDNYNQVFEHNAAGTGETNNVTTGSFASVLNSYPDLTVTGLAVTPAAPRAGQSLTINYALTNAGDGPVAQSFHYSVQVTHLPTGQSLYSRVEQYDAAALGPIPAATSKPLSATFTLPNGALGAGDLQITVKADHFNSVFEYNTAGTAETNNQAQTTVTSAAGQYPDLRVADVTVTSGTVKPGDQVLVSWTLTNGGGAAVSGPFSEKLFLSADSAAGGDDLLKTLTFDGTLGAGQSVIRNAVITVPAFGAGQRWLVVQADTANQVFEESETNNAAVSAASLSIPLGLAITATNAQLTEGGPVTNVTVSRNGPTNTPLVVTLANTQPGSLMVPTTVTIPAGSATVTFGVTPTNNTNVDGTRTAVVSATAGGFAGSSLEVTITDDDVPTLTVQLSPNPISEGEGNGSLRVRVFRNIATTSPLTVHLTSDDVLRATVPATAVIPAGATFVDVFGDIKDNIYIDGLRSVGVTASASGFTPGTDRTLFLDNDIPTLTLSAEQTTLSEGAGTYGTTATISRAVASPIDLYAQITGGNGNLILPAFVKIPAFQTSASFSIGAINNTEVSADRTVVISARPVDSFSKTPLESGRADLSIRITEDDGAALTVAAQTPTIREDGTGTVRIRRNTGTAGALTVSLLSSDPTELTVPATAVIPDGASFVDVTVTGVADGGIDGAQNVTVSASAIGYGGGSAVVTVTDSDLPDLAVTNISAPTSGETGQSVNVSYTVTNQGVVATTGTWTDRVFLSDRPVIDDRATQVRQFIRNTPLGVSGSYSQSFEIALPSGVGTAYILVQTDYVGGVTELREGNNTAASSPINVAAAYTATVQADRDVYGSGQPVHLTGLATRIGGGPAAHEFVKVNVLVNGSKRTLTAFTAADGTYQAIFQPLTTEAGNYQVAATHPGVADYVAQDSFAIAGMRVGGDSVQLTPDFVVTRSGTLSNRSSVPITGIQASILNLPEGLQLTVNVPSTLPGDGSVTLLYSLLATKPDLGHGTVTIRLTSDQGATVDVPVTVDVVPLTASLVTTPGTLDDGMIRGERKTLSFTLSNSGSAPSGAVSIALPNFPWLRLISPSTIPSLNPGASATVSLELNPAADLPLQLYTGQIGINAANGATRGLSFRFRALSVAQGDVQISVVDEYTFYVEGNPKVGGATVRLYDPFNGNLVAGGTTDAGGNITLPNVAEGSYQLEVFAPEHGTFRSRFDVKPGVTNTKEVFIQRQLVTYSWTVVPVDIQDTYKVVLQPTFQTNVPVPVVTVEEPLVMPLVVEDEWTQFNITLTNHGLIAAKGVKIQLPVSAYYEFRTLVDDVGDIPAKTTIQIPVGIRGKVGVTAAEQAIAAAEQAIRGGDVLGASQAVNLNCLEVSSGIPCLPKLNIKAVYFYECGPDDKFNSVPVDVEPVCVAKSIYECLKQAWGTAAESLPSLGGNLANAPCALIDLILQCADTGLSDCKKAMIKAACKGITGFITGGPAGAAAGVGSSIKDLLECFCDLFDFDFDIGDVELNGGGGFGGGGWGGGYTNPYGGGGGGSFSTSGCSPASGSSSTGSSPVLLAPNADGSGVCATVTLRIEQQAVLTRTGFAGTFTLKNGTAADTLSGIRVDLDIRDSSGNSANDKFGFRDPDISGLGNVSGTGVLAAGQTGTARYLFVPTRDAAPTAAQTYHIGGTLRYIDNGIEVSVPLIPATITVHPDALLTLDYFLQRDVFSDDPFTDPVEPSDPFSLGVLVNNTGAGKARNFHIISGQPEIIENEKGLLIDFDIIGTQVGGNVVSPSLTANFGDILAGTTRSARWLMTSTLQGHFIDYKATFEHVDDFGNPRTSLIDAVNFHELERAMRLGLPGKGLVDDQQFDFLANDIPDEAKLPDTLYFSTGGKALVHSYTNATTDGPVTASDLNVQLSAPSTSSTGWTYLVFPDPGASFVLKDVIRSDGSHLKVGEHAWRTDRTFGNEGVATHIDRVHLLDLESTGTYTLVYGRADEVGPSVTQLGAVTPSTRSTPVDSIGVTLSEKLATGSFDISDVTLTRNGTLITLTGVASVVRIDDTHYSVTGLSGVTAAAGAYVLSVNGAGFQDASGNAGSGTATRSWTTVADAPVVASLGTGLSPLTNGAVGQILVSFSKPIDASTFDLSDVTLTLNGTAVTLSSPATITQLNTTDFRIDALAGFTADEGTYVVSVDASGITDTVGNAGAGAEQASWTTDTTAPTITFLETLATNPRNIAVLNLDVEFSEPIDQATLTADDVSLTRNGGADLFSSGLTVTQLSPTKFRLGGFTSLTGVQGNYVFTLNGAGITDAAGNAVSNSASTSWVLDTAAPGAPTNLAITPDNGSSSLDGRTNVSTVTLSGTVPEAGSSVRVVDLTTNTNFGAGTTTGNTFTKQLTFAAPGAHRLRVYAVDAAGNVSGDSFFDVFIDLAKPTVQSVTGFGASTITVPVNELTVTFDKAVSAPSFTASDVTLTRNGAPVNLSGVTVVQVSPTVFRISGLTTATTPLGTYVLTVDLPQIFDDAGNSGTAPYAVTWQRADAVATIGDTVFVDANFNGMRDTSELPAVGVTVRLHAETGAVLGTTTTDASGHYAFGGLDADARYFVEFVAPGGYGFTHANVTNDQSDSDADVATGRTEVFDVAVGANDQWDAGIVQLGSISGQAYNDANNNRQRDAAEGALAGFTVFVDLNRNNQHEAAEPSALTAADGTYRFDNLRPGTYIVAMEVPAGWQQTTPDQAGVVVSIQSANLTPTANLAGTAVPETPTDGFSAAEKLIGLDRLAADSRFSHLTGAGYTVVVIDTGIDLNNSFFGPDANSDGIADRIAFQYDFGANDASAQDLTGHGTHIASIIGSGDSTYRGVAPGVNFVVFKIFDDGGHAIFGQAEKALQWVTNNISLYNILAVNMSFGDGRNWDWPDATDCGCGNTVKRETYGLGDELATLRSLNVITSAAAGNNFYEVSGVQGMNYPAADPATISVGAVWDSDRGGSWSFNGTSAVDFSTDADAIAAFSQRQAGYLDVFAPGAIITGAKVGGGVTTMQGTSQSTAFVTGAAVLAQQLAIDHLGRRLTLAEFRTLLQTTGVTVFDGDDENDNVINTGQAYSRLDLYALANAIMSMNPAAPPDNGADGVDGEDPNTSGQGFAYQIALAPGGSYTQANFGLRTATTPEFELGNDPLQDKVIAGYRFQRDVPFTDVDAIDDWTVTVNYGDGSAPVTTTTTQRGFSFDHLYADKGLYTITVTVTDDRGLAATDTMAFRVIPAVSDVRIAGFDGTRFLNVKTIAIDFPSNFAPGDTLPVPTITLQGGGTVPSFTYALDPANASTILVSFGNNVLPPGTYDLTLLGAGFGPAFASAHGSSVNYTFVAGVPGGNTVPVVNAGADAALNEGDEWVRVGSFIDPDADSWTAQVDYGDGAGYEPLTLAGKSFTLRHRFGDEGNFNVHVKIRDSAGAERVDDVLVTVGNVAPTFDLGSDLTVAPNGKFAAAHSFADPGADTWAATVDYGDGTGVHPLTLAGKSFTLDHVYAAPGDYSVTVTVNDGDGGVVTDTMRVKVVAAAQATFQINHGAAQRSSVNSVTITFSRPVAANPGAFVMTRRTATGVVPVALIVRPVDPDGDGYADTFELSFAGSSYNSTAKSLIDGQYDLRVLGGPVRDAAGYAAANAIYTFHRYYGDLNGNGTVDASDVNAARLALGSKLGQSSYRAELDLNGNKRIDAAEYAQVRSRLHRGPLFGPARTLPGSRGGYG